MNKSLLNTYCQKSHIGYPSYCLCKLDGLFVCGVVVDEERFKSWEGHVSKKMAEEDAAGVVLQNLVQLHPVARDVQELLECVEKERKGTAVINLPHLVPSGNPLSNALQELSPPSLPAQAGPPPVRPHPLVLKRSDLFPSLACVPPASSTTTGCAEASRTPSSCCGPPADGQVPPPETPTSIPVPLQDHASCSPPSKSLPPPLRIANLTSSQSGTSPPKERSPTSNNFMADLDSYCQMYNLPPPVYSITEKSRRFTATVVVDGTEYCGTRDHQSFERAKEYVTLVALACIGLRVLRVRGPARVDPLQDLSENPQPDPGLSRASSSSCDLQESSLKPANLPGRPSVAVSATGPCEISPQFPHPPAYFKSCVSLPGSKETATLPSGRPSLLGKSSSLQNSAALAGTSSMSNYKTTLNLFCQRNRVPQPIYDCIYPEDEVGYIVIIKVNGQMFKSTPHGTKRGAESMAAAMALKSMGVDVEVPENGDVDNTLRGPESLVAPPQIPDAQRNISYKNLLQEYLQKSQCIKQPSYDTQRTENGYESTVSVRTPPDFKSHTFQGKPHANKRAAEQACARHACMELKIIMS